MNSRKISLILVLSVLSVFSFAQKKPTPFVTIKNGQFIVNQKPYYFIGTNFWYGGILGSTGQGGNRERLLKELDFMKANGINNLRVMIGSDGDNGIPSKVEPTLQIKPGVYNDTIFQGLDFLLSEMKKRQMYAVLFFANSWEWTGGYGQYLAWAGKGENVIPSVSGWDSFLNYVKQYAQCNECHQMLKKHIRKVMSRTNRYTKVKYINDPTIFAWEIGNEPRAFADENKPAFEKWLRETSALIKSLDKNHLLTIGSEGWEGSEHDFNLFERTHSDKNIDYLTMHIWPKNWGWLDKNNMAGTYQKCVDNTTKYIDDHIAIAKKLNKPIIIEEFGFPRDNHQYSISVPTTLRDGFYTSIFNKILIASREKTLLAGCNLWSWGGFGRPNPQHTFWKKGDDYLGDPAQEEQGLNSVFNTDSTIQLVKKYVGLMQGGVAMVDENANEQTKALFYNLLNNKQKGIMLGHQDDLAYGHEWYGEPGRSDIKSVTGDYPAVTGWELGHLEIGAPYNLDSIYFTDMKGYMREVYDRGGINTISWHGDNVVTGKTAWDCGQDYVVKSVLEGGSHHAQFLVYLDKLADFFLSLKDKNEDCFPVIFRMYHEHTGNWFWWAAKQCTPDQYKALYRMTVSYLRDVKGVHNILYAYSPAETSSETYFLERYPGDEWVDIVGFDTYMFNYQGKPAIDTYKQQIKTGLEVVTNYAKRTGKVAVFAETGFEGLPYHQFFTQALWPVIKNYPVAYFLLWRNACNRPTHFYAPFPGHPSAADLKSLTDKNAFLLSKDLPDMYVRNKMTK